MQPISARYSYNESFHAARPRAEEQGRLRAEQAA